MFTDNIFTKPTELSKAIDNCIKALDDLDPGTDEYAKMVDQLTKLYKLKELDIKLILQEVELKHKLEAQETERKQKENDFQHKVDAHKVDAKLKEEELKLKREIFEAEEELRKLNVETKKREMKIPFGIKPETLALIGANLAGIVIIVGHERLHVVATKAIGFVTKLRT